MKDFLLVVLFLFMGLVSKSQDTLSIRQFDSMVIHHHKIMNGILESKDSLSSEEAIILIKIENTLSYGVAKFIGKKQFEIRKEKYRSFDSCFQIDFIRRVIVKTEGTVSVGLGYYSKKYDIMLGGNMIDPNSRYYIRKEALLVLFRCGFS